MYHFLELYSLKQYPELEKKVYDLLTFIDNTKPLNSAIVINYMINNRISSNVSLENQNDEFIDRYTRLQSSQSNDDHLRIKLANALLMSDDSNEIVEPLMELIEGLHIEQNEIFNNKYKIRGERKK